MNIEQKICAKLEPHAQRIHSGDGNDFDYLPAVLLHVIKKQSLHQEILDSFVEILRSNENTAVVIGTESKDYLSKLRGSQLAIESRVIEIQSSTGSLGKEFEIFKKLLINNQSITEELDRSINIQLNGIEDTQSVSEDKLNALAESNAVHAEQTNQYLASLQSLFETAKIKSDLNQIKLVRLLTFGLFFSVATTALTITLMLKH